jgi:hypothetical protein
MRVTPQMIEQIPRGNLRVRRAEFAAVWVEGERILENHLDRSDDWYVTGVVITCRWLACAIGPRLRGRQGPAMAPISGRTASAHEELIEAETQAAERWLAKYPRGMERRSGWLESVNATLDWAWRGNGTPPLNISHADAS